jgi:multicomponent Na+:H+ antiporter subunit F
MTAVAWIAGVLLAGAAVLAVWRALRPGTLGDRAVALDTFTAILVCAMLTAATVLEDHLFVDLVVVLTLLGFVTSVTVARFVERRGR